MSYFDPWPVYQAPNERRRKIPVEDYPIIRKRVADGEMRKVIALEYGVAASQVTKVLLGK